MKSNFLQVCKYFPALQTALLLSFRGLDFCVRNSLLEQPPCSQRPQPFRACAHDLHVVQNLTYAQYISI